MVKGNEESNIRGGYWNDGEVGELENGRLAGWSVKGCIIYRRVFLFRREIYGFRLGMKVSLELFSIKRIIDLFS